MASKLIIEISVPLAGDNIVDNASALHELKGPLEGFIATLPKGTAHKARITIDRPNAQGQSRSRRLGTVAAAALALAMVLAAPAKAEDGLINNGDGTYTGFPSYYHSGHYCDTIQIYSHGPQHFGVFKDYPAKMSQANFLQQTFINAVQITFRITGPLQCKDSLGPVIGITDINAGTPQ